MLLIRHLSRPCVMDLTVRRLKPLQMRYLMLNVLSSMPGQGVHYAQAWDSLKELAELLAAPVTTSLGRKKCFSRKSSVGTRFRRSSDSETGASLSSRKPT